MKWRTFPRSPEIPAGRRWPLVPRGDGYESEVDALIRALLDDPAVRRDQDLAWDRWWLDPEPLRKGLRPARLAAFRDRREEASVTVWPVPATGRRVVQPIARARASRTPRPSAGTPDSDERLAA